MFIINQQATCHKSVMPCDYPSHVANSSWLISNTISKAKPIIHCNVVEPQNNFKNPQFKKTHTQNKYPLKNNVNCSYCKTMIYDIHHDIL